jgi:molybdopterin biosynthesis enzyme MoaB
MQLFRPVVLTGGTGLSDRDAAANNPNVVDRRTPGIEEAIR